MVTRNWMKKADQEVCSASLTAVVEAFPHLSRPVYHLFAYGFNPDNANGSGSVKQYARERGEVTTTLISRWFRAGASKRFMPKVLLGRMMLVRMAGILEEDHVSLSKAAEALGFVSPQVCFRWLKRMTGQTVSDYRESGAAANIELQRLIRDLREAPDELLIHLQDGVKQSPEKLHTSLIARFPKCPRCGCRVACDVNAEGKR